jgi:hypothetical protein
MTAVVGILNKQAVAIAADSAVTIGGSNGRKIFNRANKVFTLSKYHPVGVMLYNSASFMSTPWETIIKVYRKKLANNSFPTLKEYQEDFIEFVRSKNFYSNENDQRQFLFGFCNTLINEVVREIVKDNRHLIEATTQENKTELLNQIGIKVDDYVLKFNDENNFCPDFIDYSFEDFEVFISPIFQALIEQNFTVNGYISSPELQDRLKRFLYVYLKTKENFTNFTGLIFTGFGEDEIYPSLIPINISLAIDSRLRFYVDDNKAANINNDNNGAICPFAQTDVIDTILTGIAPKLDETYILNFEAYFTKYNEAILNIIGDNNPELSAQLQGIDIKELVREYASKNLETKRSEYINPLMNAVSSLSKEDLAEMAESLIYLTYLKRRITFAEESVGGPVDVAIISKGDGFIWIKRKHYFKPELNKYFFDNYFNT